MCSGYSNHTFGKNILIGIDSDMKLKFSSEFGIVFCAIRHIKMTPMVHASIHTNLSIKKTNTNQIGFCIANKFSLFNHCFGKKSLSE